MSTKKLGYVRIKFAYLKTANFLLFNCDVLVLQRPFLKQIEAMKDGTDATSEKLQQMQDELRKLELEEVGQVIRNLV